VTGRVCQEVGGVSEVGVVGKGRKRESVQGHIDGVMDGQDGLVIGPELAQVEAVAFEVLRNH